MGMIMRYEETTARVPHAEGRANQAHSAHGMSIITPAIWRSAVQDAMCQQGMRITGPRTVILDWIAAVETPFTADQLVAALDTQPELGSCSTIYRTVELLLSAGWIGRVHAEWPNHHYLRRWPDHQALLICSQCHTVTIFSGIDLAVLLAPLVNGTQFAVRQQVLELYGFCSQCEGRA